MVDIMCKIPQDYSDNASEELWCTCKSIEFY
jgi:hypothetical protein